MDDDTETAVIILVFIAAFLIIGYYGVQLWQRETQLERTNLPFVPGQGWDSNPRAADGSFGSRSANIISSRL